MFWCDKLLQNVDGPQIINDSKTPSGRVHVGSIRGVIIHDVAYRILKERGVPVEYRFGVDDYDPVDEIPYGEREHYEQYLGMPLCNVPPPPDSSASDMAEHFIKEFFDVFEELDVQTTKYRMRDIYRSGQFNEAIDTILKHPDIVRQVYVDVSKTKRNLDNWYPFQPICEQCGRIGTTEVSDYDGKEVTYICQPEMVTWARGCGYRGKVSPFDGNGKLPWKLEWVAKWHSFPVTIEGAGKDHSTKGGSRDVASSCLRKIFGDRPPLNIPYEFFLVGGQKMSSSHGRGASARDMADFLPPELLRFLMLRSAPNRPVNFTPDEANIIKLFNEFDRFHQQAEQETAKEENKRVYALSAPNSPGAFYDANFQLVTVLVQMPHLDLIKEIEKQKGSPLSDVEKVQLERRAASARYWVEHYADDSEKTHVQEVLPNSAETLSVPQRGFLNQLAAGIADCDWTADSLQTIIFTTARETPIPQGAAFQAIYRVVLDRESGPKAGNLLAVLERDFVIKRLTELDVDVAELWTETAVDLDTLSKWLDKQSSKLATGCAKVAEQGELAVVELRFTLQDGKTHVQRLCIDAENSADHLIAEANELAAIEVERV